MALYATGLTLEVYFKSKRYKFTKFLHAVNYEGFRV